MKLMVSGKEIVKHQHCMARTCPASIGPTSKATRPNVIVVPHIRSKLLDMIEIQQPSGIQ